MIETTQVQDSIIELVALRTGRAHVARAPVPDWIAITDSHGRTIYVSPSGKVTPGGYRFTCYST